MVLTYLPVRKLSALEHTHRSRKYLYINTYSTRKSMIRVDFWKGLLKKKDSFELNFELREGWEIPETGRQRIPDRWSDKTEGTLANRF